jgi:lipid-A-disaccharide synthase
MESDRVWIESLEEIAEVKGVMKVFFSVGEPSGDLHGANLVQSLQEQGEVECVGFGGPKMAAAGCRLEVDLTEYAVMGFTQVVGLIPKFWQLYRQAGRYFDQHRPDAVVLIDFPGFNWWVARAAKARGIPVYYYGTPQMWAWAGWRVRKMRRLVDLALCKLPFEEDWFQARGCPAAYVGHPYFDELSARTLDQDFLQDLSVGRQPWLTILPGSRTQEVRQNFKFFLRAAELVRARVPGLRVTVASFNEKQAELARVMAEQEGVEVEIYVKRTPELIQAADCCLACSGSVSLELLYHEKPTAILYWVPRWQYLLVRYLLVRVRYITLVNLLATEEPFVRAAPFDPDQPGADEVPFPEYPTCEDKSPQLARHATQWLTDSRAKARKVEQLSQLRSRFARPGASREAARRILEHLKSRGAGVAESAAESKPRAA